MGVRRGGQEGALAPPGPQPPGKFCPPLEKKSAGAHVLTLDLASFKFESRVDTRITLIPQVYTVSFMVLFVQFTT